MAIELVTGHAGQEHVSSADAGRFNAGVCGTGKYVLDTGLKFAYSIESANLIRISSGDAVNQGRHITIPPNTYEDAALLNGAQGKTRIDVITLRYSKVTRQVDSETVTLEEASVEVVKGTEVPTGTTPEVPAVISGNIFGGATADGLTQKLGNLEGDIQYIIPDFGYYNGNAYIVSWNTKRDGSVFKYFDGQGITIATLLDNGGFETDPV